jgi:hypothetical protein
LIISSDIVSFWDKSKTTLVHGAEIKSLFQDSQILTSLVDVVARQFRAIVSEDIVCSIELARVDLILKLACNITLSMCSASPKSEVHLTESFERLIGLFLPWLLIADQTLTPSSSSGQSSCGSATRFSTRFNWTKEQRPYVENVLALFFQYLAKLCSICSKSFQAPQMIWSVYTQLIEARISGEFLEVFQDRALECDWTHFEFQQSTIDKMSQWITDYILSDTVIKFCMTVLEHSAPHAWQSNNITLWCFVFHVVHRLGLSWPTEAERLVIRIISLLLAMLHSAIFVIVFRF